MRRDKRLIIRPGKVRRLRAIYELSKAAPEGCLVEVGVLAGSSARFLNRVAEEQGRELYLYDTFEGHPWATAQFDIDKAGDRKYEDIEAIREMCPSAIVTKGIFPYSVIDMPPVAFAHIDVDVYKSYKLAIEALRPLMAEGGMMYFDDWRHHPGCRRAVQKAFGKGNFGHIPNLFRAYKIFGQKSEVQARAIKWCEDITKDQIIKEGITLGELGFEPVKKKARKNA